MILHLLVALFLDFGAVELVLSLVCYHQVKKVSHEPTAVAAFAEKYGGDVEVRYLLSHTHIYKQLQLPTTCRSPHRTSAPPPFSLFPRAYFYLMSENFWLKLKSGLG
jgi:hypothetical protein